MYNETDHRLRGTNVEYLGRGRAYCSSGNRYRHMVFNLETIHLFLDPLDGDCGKITDHVTCHHINSKSSYEALKYLHRLYFLGELEGNGNRI